MLASAAVEEKKASLAAAPVISFVPVMVQLLLAGVCAAAAATLQPYLRPGSGSSSGSSSSDWRLSPAGPVAEGADERGNSAASDPRVSAVWPEAAKAAVHGPGYGRGAEDWGAGPGAAAPGARTASAPEHVLLQLPGSACSLQPGALCAGTSCASFRCGLVAACAESMP